MSMRNCFLTAIASALAASMAPAAAQQTTPALQALDDATPGTLINDPSALDWAIHGKDQTSKIIQSPEIPGGGAAIQFTVTRAGSNIYDSGANAPITAPIRSGTDVAALFWARTVQSGASDGKGRIGVRFQQNVEPYAGFGDGTLVIEKEWKQYQISGRADRSFAKGQAVLAFQLAGGKQVIEIGQTIIVSGAKSILSKDGPAPIDLHPKLIGKGKPITSYATQSWPLYGSGATSKKVPAKEVPGGQAVQFTLSAAGTSPHDIGLSIPLNETVNSGDTLIVAVLARTVSAATADGKGRLGLRLQKNEAPYPGFGDATLPVGPNWGLYQLKTQARMDLEVGKSVVSVHLAGAQQVIEIGQVYVLTASSLTTMGTAEPK
jgi:hypothetical protein